MRPSRWHEHKYNFLPEAYIVKDVTVKWWINVVFSTKFQKSTRAKILIEYNDNSNAADFHLLTLYVHHRRRLLASKVKLLCLNN